MCVMMMDDGYLYSAEYSYYLKKTSNNKCYFGEINVYRT